MRFVGSPFLVLLTLILSALPDHTYANSANDPGITPESSAIDTSKMRVGTPVVIVYGLGIADPTTGEWPKLATATGTIQAINEQRLLLAQKGQDLPQRIDLQRIKRLNFLDPSEEKSHTRGETLPPFPSSTTRSETMADDRLSAIRPAAMGSVSRIGRKLGSGVVLGWIGLMGGILILGLTADCPDSDNGDFMYGCGWESVPRSASIAYPVASAYGVSLPDPDSRFIPALVGSIAGLALSRPADLVSLNLAQIDSRWEAYSLFLYPVVGAVAASEFWRSPKDPDRISIRPQPLANGSISAMGVVLLF